MQKQPRLLDQVRERIRCKHYNIRTEKSYLDWIRRFISFHGKKHPVEMGAAEIEAFLPISRFRELFLLRHGIRR
ncbi:MAG: phage integrase N-terminal SAM-like domain-containing protein [Methylococcales bacterium]